MCWRWVLFCSAILCSWASCFSVALFSALEQLHCTLVSCDPEWVTMVCSGAVLSICQSVYLSAIWLLHTWCRVKLLPSWYTLCVYHKPCASLQCHFMQSYIRRVQVCLAVIWYLCFWKSDWDLLCATVVTQGWNGSWTKSGHRKLTLEKKILLQLLPALTPKTFQS